MADGRVNLRFSTVADTRGMNEISDGLKKTARTQKDFVDGGVKLVGQLSAKFNNELTTAVSGSFDVLQNIVRGGLWGGMAAVASLAIGKIVEKWEEAKKKAAEYSKLIRQDMVSAAEKVAAAFKGTAAALEKERKETAKLLAAQNAAIENRAANAAADAETAYLVNGGGSVAKAEADRVAGLAAATAKVEKAAAAEEAAFKNVETASAGVAKAQDALAAATTAREELEHRSARIMYEYQTLLRNVYDIEKDYANQGLTLDQATKLAAGYRLALAKFEKEHADDLAALKKVTELEANARTAVADAETKLADAQAAASEATDKKLLADKQLLNDELRLDDSVRAAKEAEEKLKKEKEERAKAEAAARKKAEERRAAIAAAEAEAAAKAERREELERTVNKIEKELANIDRRDADRKKLEDRLASGRDADARRKNGTFGPFEYGGRSNGAPNATDDMRALRYSDAAARDAGKAARRDAANAQRAERLRRLSPQAISDADKKWLDNWENVSKRKEAAAADERARKDLQAKRDRAIEESRDILKEIRDDLAAANKLG